MDSNIEDKLDEIETKLDNTISKINANNYANEMKQKKQFEQWLGLLYNEFKKELKKTKEEIIKEIKNGNKR
ncbi:MAG: hypothetical protein EOL97_12855 [Spirochaetia bacterium]|nr:hypothetical protein [Spirochaetia bacterium]